MNKKIVGIVVFGLLISTALPALGIINEKTNKKSSEIVGDRGYLFMQLPDSSPNTWTSNDYMGYYCYDDFWWNVSNPICDIHWWGKCMEYVGNIWYPRDPTGMLFNISFYEDDNGTPGALVYSYNDVAPSITWTGIFLNYHVPGSPYWCELYYFEYDLEPCLELSNGWVSIYSSYHPTEAGFNWKTSLDGNIKLFQYDSIYNQWYQHSYDLAFILTDGEEDPIPDLECDGSLSWDKVKSGANVTGNFTVRNNGDAGSILHWKVDESSIPSWGSNWTFNPNASILTIGSGWITVEVNVTAPEEKGEYTGKIKVVNAVDPSDYCEIDVYLKKPRSRPIYNTLLLQLFERFSNAFPILRQLLRLY